MTYTHTPCTHEAFKVYLIVWPEVSQTVSPGNITQPSHTLILLLINRDGSRCNTIIGNCQMYPMSYVRYKAQVSISCHLIPPILLGYRFMWYVLLHLEDWVQILLFIIYLYNIWSWHQSEIDGKQMFQKHN